MPKFPNAVNSKFTVEANFTDDHSVMITAKHIDFMGSDNKQHEPVTLAEQIPEHSSETAEQIPENFSATAE